MAGCVYRIVCSQNSKVYVGKTGTTFETRRQTHLSALKHGRCTSKKLQADYDQYGRQVFYFEVLERDISFDLLDEREWYWIAHFDSYENGYNCNPGSNRTPCVFNGIQYPSITAAARKNDISVPTMHKWITCGYTCDADVKQGKG